MQEGPAVPLQIASSAGPGSTKQKFFKQSDCQSLLSTRADMFYLISRVTVKAYNQFAHIYTISKKYSIFFQLDNNIVSAG